MLLKLIIYQFGLDGARILAIRRSPHRQFGNRLPLCQQRLEFFDNATGGWVALSDIRKLKRVKFRLRNVCNWDQETWIPFADIERYIRNTGPNLYQRYELRQDVMIEGLISPNSEPIKYNHIPAIGMAMKANRQITHSSWVFHHGQSKRAMLDFRHRNAALEWSRDGGRVTAWRVKLESRKMSSSKWWITADAY